MNNQDIDISVIIVSYNTRDLTLACVRSVLQRAGHARVQIIVVDNASDDGSAASVRQAFSSVTLIANDDNRGFAAANNQGLEVATGEYLLLLNPDTELHEGCLDRTLAFARAHSEAGVIGCRAFRADGSQQSSIMRSPRLWHLFINVFVPNRLIRRSRFLGHARYQGIDLDHVQDVEVVVGCFMLLPRKVYEAVGGLDEAFFLYGEEVEWCVRIRRAGWRILYFPEASILHYGGVSTEKNPDDMSLAMARSQLILLQKLHGRSTAFIANLLMFLRDLPRAVLWTLLGSTGLPCEKTLREALRRSALRCRLHARGLLRLDWSG